MRSLFLACFVLLACDRGSGASRGGPPSAAERASPVAVATVLEGPIQARTTYVAEVAAGAKVEIAAKIEGHVDRVLVDLGDTVREGETLARIEDRLFRQAQREADAQVALAEAGVTQAEVRHQGAVRDHGRKKKLFDEGHVSPAELDAAETALLSAQADLALARAQVADARTRLERARIDLRYTQITAPFAGAIAERLVDTGALVRPGTPLFRLTSTGSLVVRFAAPERDVVRLGPGQPFELSVDALSDRFRGTVERISPVVDPETRTTPVEGRLDANGVLRPGMFARVEVTLESKDAVPLLPARAVIRRQSGATAATEGVFVVDGDRAVFRPVRIGLRSREVVEVVEGVVQGDRVIAAGHADLRDGGKIKIVEGEDAPGDAGGT